MNDNEKKNEDQGENLPRTKEERRGAEELNVTAIQLTSFNVHI